PDFNVIPFIGDHFKKRYADQQWLIYDTQRDYGLYYDLETMQLIKLSNSDWAGRKQIKPSVLKEGEQEFKQLWSQYFKSTSIKERKNMKLHLQHVPRRYWRYLPEKS
ncbi:MAG: TIGR03915 family putative DNA repair protein, partial [Bacteroidota bacterium]